MASTELPPPTAAGMSAWDKWARTTWFGVDRGALSANPQSWSIERIPDQTGRVVVITGGNSGIGFETAKALSRRGARVVLACRDLEKAAGAASRIRAEHSLATVDVQKLDLGSLASVRLAAAAILDRYPRLDLLINNAGVMLTRRHQTSDGFELNLGVNHLGHFALTGLLLDRLTATQGSRVVVVTSAAHHQGRLDFDDLNFDRRRSWPTAAYAQSKLATVMFAYELQRRLAGTGTIAVAVHPGIVPTELARNASWPLRTSFNLLARLVGQPNAAAGALVTLRAATDPDARGGEYFAPDGRPTLRAKGTPVVADSSESSHDREAQQRLWAVSEQLTGVSPRGGPRDFRAA